MTELSARDQALLVFLEDSVPPHARSVSRIIVSLEEEPNRSLALYINPAGELVAVGEVEIGDEHRQFVAVNPYADDAPPFYRDVASAFGEVLYLRYCGLHQSPYGVDPCTGH